MAEALGSYILRTAVSRGATPEELRKMLMKIQHRETRVDAAYAVGHRALENGLTEYAFISFLVSRDASAGRESMKKRFLEACTGYAKTLEELVKKGDSVLEKGEVNAAKKIYRLVGEDRAAILDAIEAIEQELMSM